MAIFLHVHWHDNKLFLWGESAETSKTSASIDELRAAFGELSPDDALLGSIAPAATSRLWLPVNAEGVVIKRGDPAATSSHQNNYLTLPLNGENGTSSSSNSVSNGHASLLHTGELRAVELDSLCFSPAQAIDLLTSLPTSLPDNCGDSIQYWREASNFVLDLLARRQIVPNMDAVTDGYEAKWRVVVQDRNELDWLEHFANAMPAVCRAQVLVEGLNLEPAAVLENFLSATGDALVRRCVADDGFFKQPAERVANVSSAADFRPPETRWLTALLGDNPRVPGTEDENTRLIQVVQSWISQIEPSAAAVGMRLVFRLVEPPDDPVEVIVGEESLIDELATPTGPWQLQLLLESESEDADLLSAHDLWEESASIILLGRSIKNRQARLLSELSRAAQIFPALFPLLSQAAPKQLELDSPDAYAFIRQWSVLLRERDFGIILPMWADRPEGELGLRLNVRPLSDLQGDFDANDMGGEGSGSSSKYRGSTPMELPSGHFGLDALLQFDWQIAVGNMTLTPTEFQKIASKNVPLVKLRGQWVRIDLDAAKQASLFLEKQNDKTLTLAEALRAAYGTSKSETGLPVLGLGGSSWIDDLLQQVPGLKIEHYPQPASFQGQLRPYQLRGLHWMAFLDRLGIGACLADDMGLGKTIQLIALLLHERELAEKIQKEQSGTLLTEADTEKFPCIAAASLESTSESAAADKPISPAPVISVVSTPGPYISTGILKKPTLLFAPTSVVGNWVRELQRFAKGLVVYVHHGADRLNGETFATRCRESDVVITSYALAHRDRDDLAKVAWHRIALDEAQKIKNPSAAGTIAIRGLTASRRIAMTGTPIENHLSELWSIMEILNPGLLGTAGNFREQFAVPIEKLGDRERSDQLRRLIKPFVLRRLKTDPDIAGDLPEKMEAKVFCNLSPEQAAQYEMIVGQSLNQIDAATGIRRRGLILSVLTRLKQICDHPALVLKEDGPIDGRSGKCERLVEMLEELLDEGDAALVFTQFREMGHLLEKLVTTRLNVKTQFLHGGTPAKMRDEMIENFQNPANGIKIFILSLRAGGLGLNLTAANHVFHFDRWWNPAVESQATDRAHRVGQTRKVQVHKFVCIGTMEERIDRLLTEKLALADKIVGSGDEWITNMSTDQLREYLTLTKEAIGEF